MRITPLDIRKQEFRRAMRGLDPEEVYAFLATVAEEYEAVLSDNKAFRERVLELDDKVREYRTMERTLRDTLLTAERVTADAKDNARREANLIIKEAQIEAEKALRDIKNQAMKLNQEVQKLRRERENYLARMKMLAESHMKFIEGEEKEFEEERLKAGLAIERQMDGESRKAPSQEIPAQRRKEPSMTEASAAGAVQRELPRVEPVPDKPRRTSLPPADMEDRVKERAAGEKPSEHEAVPSKASADRDAALRAKALRDQSDLATFEPSSIPELNAILDRMVEGQREVLRADTSSQQLVDQLADPEESQEDFEPIPPGKDALLKSDVTPPESVLDSHRDAPRPKQPSAPDEKESEWSLEKIKRDILSDPSSHSDR